MNEIKDNVDIIITTTEETAINIRINTDTSVGDKFVSIMVEPWQCTQMASNSWVRDSLLFDIENIGERYDIATCIMALYMVIAEGSDIIQISISKNVVTVMDTTQVEKVLVAPYADIDTDVSHIVRHKPFFSTTDKIGITEENGHDAMNIINKKCHIGYVGYNEDNVVDITTQTHLFISSMSDIEMILDDKQTNPPTFILVVSPTACELACSIIDKYHKVIDCVICNTYLVDRRMACMMLSICKNRGVMCCRGLSIAGRYNFGVEKPANIESEVGLINMDDDLLTDDYHYLILVDSRMAQLRDFVIILNKRKGVKIILIKHVVNDSELRCLNNYKIYPAFQTHQLSQIDQLSRGHVLHTAIAMQTQNAGIANMMVQCGIFASCNADTVNKYKRNVLNVLNNVVVEEEEEEYCQELLDNVLTKKFEKFTIVGKKSNVMTEIQNNNN
jgi:hypothetical protein